MADPDSGSVSIDYDHHSLEYALDSAGINRAARERCPVAWTAAHDGYWVATGHDAVSLIAHDDATFSSDHDITGTRDARLLGVAIPPLGNRSLPIEMDPPDFLELRRALNPLFAPAVVERWHPFIEAITTACIDRVIETGRIDLVLDLANPVPAITTLALLGLPLEQWDLYAAPSHDFVASVPGTPEWQRAVEGQRWIHEQLAEAVADRRRRPRDDVISAIACLELGGHPIAEADATAVCGLVIAGGVDTTTALLANSFAWLSEHSDERTRLRHDPSLIPLAREEFLRFYAPNQALARTVTRDVEVEGACLRAGDRVLVNWAAANRDPAAWDHPEQVVLDRFPNRHFSFGVGVHRCIGSNLARADYDIVLGAVLARMPDFVVDLEASRQYPSIGINNGFVEMPATFTPGSRAGADDHMADVVAAGR